MSTRCNTSASWTPLVDPAAAATAAVATKITNVATLATAAVPALLLLSQPATASSSSPFPSSQSTHRLVRPTTQPAPLLLSELSSRCATLLPPIPLRLSVVVVTAAVAVPLSHHQLFLLSWLDISS